MPPIVPGRKKVDNILLHYGQKYGILIDISFAYPQIHQGRSSHRNVPRIDDNYNVQYLTYKGILAENYVAEVLFSKKRELYYWQLDSGKYEVDFLINIEGDIIPIEVKASDNITSKSLNYYIDRYKPKYSIRISTKNFGFSNGIKSIPLYATHLI